MDNISFLIFWGFIIFVLPRIFGKNQKKGKRFEYPDEKVDNTKTEEAKESDNPWLTWGLPERAQLPEAQRPVAVNGTAYELVPQKESRKKPTKTKNVLEEKAKPSQRLSHSDLKRAVIFSEVLGKPRALKPYNDRS